MQRVGWSIGLPVVVLVALGAAGARAQEFEVADGDTHGPRLSVEYGRSPTQVGFALEIAGGVPFSHALLSVQSDGVPQKCTLVALDEHGEARLVERNAWRGVQYQVSCAIPATFGGAPGSAVVRTAVIDPSSATPPPLALSSPGDLVICEVMKDPSFVTDSAGEWFEIRNRTNQVINLDGWKLTDAGTNSHTIHNTNGVFVQPKSYFILGINADPLTNGGVQVGYKYSSSFSLANGADEIRLSDPSGVLVDVVSYDDGIFWPDDAGKSISLNRAMIDSTTNDDGANWCSAISPMSGGNTDAATPRLANNTCP